MYLSLLPKLKSEFSLYAMCIFELLSDGNTINAYRAKSCSWLRKLSLLLDEGDGKPASSHTMNKESLQGDIPAPG
jgi:hypothetical protein